MATGALYNDWFDKFAAKLAREDTKDFTAPTINLNRPEDRKRLLLRDDKQGLITALPLTGEITDEQKEMLYNAAEMGSLFVVPLCEIKPLQANIEEGKEIEVVDFGPDGSFKYTGETMPKPQVQQLGFFKNILNKLFGLFQEERIGYINTYNEQIVKFNRLRNQALFAKTARDSGDYLNGRDYDMKRGNETWRKHGRRALEATENKLKDTTLPQWQRDALEIKRDLFIEVVDTGPKKKTEAQVRDILCKLTLDTLLSKKPELAKQMEADPQQMQTLLEVINMSKIIKIQVDYNASVDNTALASCAFADSVAGDLERVFSAEMKDRMLAAKTLVADNLMAPVPNTMDGVKQLFNNPQIDERIEQLKDARTKIPEELLKQTKVGVVKKFVGDEMKIISPERTVLEDRMTIDLDDPRVYQTLTALRNAAKNEPVKANEGPVMGATM